MLACSKLHSLIVFLFLFLNLSVLVVGYINASQGTKRVVSGVVWYDRKEGERNGGNGSGYVRRIVYIRNKRFIATRVCELPHIRCIIARHIARCYIAEHLLHELSLNPSYLA